jgi:hypothetical protein
LKLSLTIELDGDIPDLEERLRDVPPGAACSPSSNFVSHLVCELFNARCGQQHSILDVRRATQAYAARTAIAKVIQAHTHTRQGCKRESSSRRGGAVHT